MRVLLSLRTLSQAELSNFVSGETVEADDSFRFAPKVVDEDDGFEGMNSSSSPAKDLVTKACNSSMVVCDDRDVKCKSIFLKTLAEVSALNLTRNIVI